MTALVAVHENSPASRTRAGGSVGSPLHAIAPVPMGTSPHVRLLGKHILTYFLTTDPILTYLLTPYPNQPVRALVF